MPWFRVDDGFHSHPKVLTTKAAALGLWVVAGSWSSANLTGGFIPKAVLPRLMPGAARLAKELVASGLWIEADSGFTFHDWVDYNPSVEEVTADREAARERMRNLRVRRRQQQDPPAETHEPTEVEPQERSGEHPANVRENFARSSEDVRNPVPSRPVPSANTSSQSSIPPYPAGRPDDDDDEDFSQVDEMVMRLLAPLAAQPITPQHAAWSGRRSSPKAAAACSTSRRTSNEPGERPPAVPPAKADRSTLDGGRPMPHTPPRRTVQRLRSRRQSTKG